MSILKYGSTAISPTPRVVIERERVGSPEGAFQGIRHVWRIEGEVIAASAALIQTAYEALQTLFASDGHDLVLYADDGTTVKHSLIHSQTLQGVKITRPFSHPKGEGAELATLRSWSVEIGGIVLLAGAPSATAWGDYTVAQTTDAQGQVRLLVSGAYRGPGAAAAAAAAKLTGRMTESEEVRTNQDTGEVSFSYLYLDTSACREQVSFVETVSLESGLDVNVFRKPLGAGTPIKQTTVKNTAKGTQAGEAVGRTAFPAQAAALWDDEHLVSRRSTKRCGRPTKDGQITEFVRAWEYVFEFATTPSLPNPNGPL